MFFSFTIPVIKKSAVVGGDSADIIKTQGLIMDVSLKDLEKNSAIRPAIRISPNHFKMKRRRKGLAIAHSRMGKTSTKNKPNPHKMKIKMDTASMVRGKCLLWILLKLVLHTYTSFKTYTSH